MQETVSGSGISWAICTSAVGCRKLSRAADSRGRWTRRVSGSRAFHSRGRGEYGRLPHKWASGSKFSLGTTTLAGVSKFCIKSGHLVHRQITKFFATGCQTLRLKYTKFDFGWGSARDLNGGAYSLQEGGGCLTSAAGTRGRATRCGLVRSSSCAGNQRVRNTIE